MQPKTPAAPNAPVLAPSQVTIGGAPLPGAAFIYQAFKAQRNELGNQLDNLQQVRNELTSQLSQLPAGNIARTGIEARIAGMDTRIVALDKQIADADAQVARAAAVPGAAIEPPRFVQRGPPQDATVLTGLFMIIVLLPLSVAFSRRIWRRSAAVVAGLPRELMDRLGRVEQSVDATAVEVERIGEGQRFLTRLFTEGYAARGLGAPQTVLVERKSIDAGKPVPR